MSRPDKFLVIKLSIKRTLHHFRYEDAGPVPPGGESTGQKMISINGTFNMKKLLMVKASSEFQFAVSEVEFFKCTSKYKYVLEKKMKVLIYKKKWRSTIVMLCLLLCLYCLKRLS